LIIIYFGSKWIKTSRVSGIQKPSFSLKTSEIGKFASRIFAFGLLGIQKLGFGR